MCNAVDSRVPLQNIIIIHNFLAKSKYLHKKTQKALLDNLSFACYNKNSISIITEVTDMKHTIGFAYSQQLGTVAEVFSLYRQCGLESTFTSVGSREELCEWANLAVKNGLLYSSLHAPFKKAAKMWDESLEGEDAEQELSDCIRACAELGVPILVVHPFIGFYPHEPTAIGAARYTRLAEQAASCGIKIALENVEGEAELACLMDTLRDFDSVGFCLDTGHELCYNRGKDMLSLYGDRLIYTHINSNIGVTDPNGVITYLDDSHMLPFDGLADMAGLAHRLQAHGYTGDLMMELSKGNHRDRHTNDRYEAMTVEEYVAEAAARIKRLRDLVDNA